MTLIRILHCSEFGEIQCKNFFLRLEKSVNPLTQLKNASLDPNINRIEKDTSF